MNSSLNYVAEDDLNMLTDMYELAMSASYFDNKKMEQATFDLFIRGLPPNRSYFLFAGLEQVLLFLEKMKFTKEHIEFLKEEGFKDEFLDYLKTYKFTGTVWAVPEGSIAFPNEPMIRVTAPIIEAQLIETFLLNTVNLQTMIATKASRVTTAAKGKRVIEFGLRREHGIDAGMKVARSSYIAGCDGTSNVLAGMLYGIPIFGTMAHSFVMSFGSELDSFRAFTKTFPDNATLLIDTYDNISGAQNAVLVAKELEQRGFKLGAIRLDSGDLIEISKKVRGILDKKGLEYVKIFASGNLDEYTIEKLLKNGAKIDAFGVGTRMGTSEDKPYVNVVYKLCEKMNEKGEFNPIMKLSEGKVTLPGRKQVFRFKDTEGYLVKDVIALDEEETDGDPLLVKVMENGKIVQNLPSLKEIKATAMENLSQLPEKYKKIKGAPKYPILQSIGLKKLTEDLIEQLKRTEIT